MNSQIATSATYPYILLRVAPKLMTTYQPGYDGQGNWTSIAQSFYGAGSSTAGSATPYYTGVTAGNDLQRDATSTALSISSSSITYGTLITLTATVSHGAGLGNPTGTVVFFRDGSQVPITSAQCGSGGVATVNNVLVPAGSYSNITAVYGGDASYNPSTSSTASLTVAKYAPTISLSAAAPYGTSNPNTYGSDLTLTATLSFQTGTGSAGPTGQVLFYNTVNGSDVAASLPCRVSNNGYVWAAMCTLNNLPAGSLSLKAVYQGDSNYATVNTTITQVVNKAPLTVTANSASMVHGNTLPTFTASYAGWVLNDIFYWQVTGQPSLTTTAD